MTKEKCGKEETEEVIMENVWFDVHQGGVTVHYNYVEKLGVVSFD